MGTCEMWSRAEGTGTSLTNAGGGCVPQLFYLYGGFECMCQHSYLKRAGVLMSRSCKVDGIQIFLWGVAWWTCMQNLGAWKMLGKCSTRCCLEMWSLRKA
jgi:hypothetical protein